MPDLDLSQRHPSVRQIMQWFRAGHLPEPAQTISRYAKLLAEAMVCELEDGPELTAGLRKLLEAKDCFVRASLSGRPGVDEERF